MLLICCSNNPTLSRSFESELSMRVRHENNRILSYLWTSPRIIGKRTRVTNLDSNLHPFLPLVVKNQYQLVTLLEFHLPQLWLRIMTRTTLYSYQAHGVAYARIDSRMVLGRQGKPCNSFIPQTLGTWIKQVLTIGSDTSHYFPMEFKLQQTSKAPAKLSLL